MSRHKHIPDAHRAVAAAAVRAILGPRAVVREMVEVPAGTPFRKRVGAVHHGIRTFWSRWTARNPIRGNGE